jgi:hypothetical protein
MRIKIFLILVLFFYNTKANLALDISAIISIAGIGLIYQIGRTLLTNSHVGECHELVDYIGKYNQLIADKSSKINIEIALSRMNNICTYYKPFTWEYIVPAVLFVFLIYKMYIIMNKLYHVDRLQDRQPLNLKNKSFYWRINENN